jgi:hypothetical protein
VHLEAVDGGGLEHCSGGGGVSLTAELDAASAPETVSYDEFLAGCWGDAWQGLRAQFPDSQLDVLERRIVPATVPAWEEVAPALGETLRERLQAARASWRHKFESEDELDFDSIRRNPRRMQIAEHGRAELAAIVGRWQSRLDALIALSFDLTVEANEAMWDEDLVRPYPLVEFNAPGLPSIGRFSMPQKWVRFPRIVTYMIDFGRHPELGDAMLRMPALRAERDAALRKRIGEP